MQTNKDALVRHGKTKQKPSETLKWKLPLLMSSTSIIFSPSIFLSQAAGRTSGKNDSFCRWEGWIATLHEIITWQHHMPKIYSRVACQAPPRVWSTPNPVSDIEAANSAPCPSEHFELNLVHGSDKCKHLAGILGV